MKTSERSRFIPPDKRVLWRPHDDFKVVPFNLLKHEDVHQPLVFVHTTKATLDTVISTPWYPPRDFAILSMRANVAGAPSGAALVWDSLIGGNSIFANTAERIQIASGELYGRKTVPSRYTLPEGSKWQFQGVTLSSATGPLVITVELQPL